MLQLFHPYPVHKLANHAIPYLCLWIPRSVFPIWYNGDLVFNSDVFGDLRGKVHTVSLILVVALIKLPVLLQHHVRTLLQNQHKGRRTAVWTNMMAGIKRNQSVYEQCTTYETRTKKSDVILVKNRHVYRF